MKSFIDTIYFNRNKEDNFGLEYKAKKEGFKNSSDLVYLGYEVEMEVEINENSRHKVLKINGIDVSDKNITI